MKRKKDIAKTWLVPVLFIILIISMWQFLRISVIQIMQFLGISNELMAYGVLVVVIVGILTVFGITYNKMRKRVFG